MAKKKMTIEDLAATVENLTVVVKEGFKKTATKDELENLALITAKGFASVDERFERVDERFEKMDERFDKMDERFDKLEFMVGGHGRRLDKTEDNIRILKTAIGK